ncbi:unannotated protein [freshwater metagenome]|uniref:Unannotated protein n=1 Tax=freshwater metagenome TaxID=449393 RepID=A0A6J7RZP8_9ZZZZ
MFLSSTEDNCLLILIGIIHINLNTLGFSCFYLNNLIKVIFGIEFPFFYLTLN